MNKRVYTLIIINQYNRFRFLLMVFNATFNNISVMSLWLVLFVEETGIPREHHQPVTGH